LADGHAEIQRISESSHESCNVVNKRLWSNRVDNSKRQRRFVSYDSRLIRRREQNIVTPSCCL